MDQRGSRNQTGSVEVFDLRQWQGRAAAQRVVTKQRQRLVFGTGEKMLLGGWLSGLLGFIFLALTDYPARVNTVYWQYRMMFLGICFGCGLALATAMLVGRMRR